MLFCMVKYQFQTSMLYLSRQCVLYAHRLQIEQGKVIIYKFYCMAYPTLSRQWGRNKKPDMSKHT